MYIQDAIRLKIKKLMDENNLNGNKLSLNAGISRSTISRFLRGGCNSISIDSITLICQALGITLKDFFNDELFNDVEIKD